MPGWGGGGHKQVQEPQGTKLEASISVLCLKEMRADQVCEERAK